MDQSQFSNSEHNPAPSGADDFIQKFSHRPNLLPPVEFDAGLVKANASKNKMKWNEHLLKKYNYVALESVSEVGVFPTGPPVSEEGTGRMG